MFPKLRYDKKLKKFSDYVLLYGYHPSEVKVIHPSHAFILSLCAGSLSTDEIKYVFRETYGLTTEESDSTVDSLLLENAFAIEIQNEPSCEEPSYEPAGFIYPCQEEKFRLARQARMPVPAGINISLTFGCNFKCSYCYQVVQSGKQSKQNRLLDKEKCLSLIREAAEYGMVHIGLTGGEPTLFPGWIDLLEEIIRLGMYPTFTSNGCTIGSDPSIAKQLRAIGLREMTVSLDASYAELHHTITNSSDSFQKVIQGIRSLLDEGIRVTVKYVLTPVNFHDLANFIDFAVELGVHQIGITSMEGGAMDSPANSMQSLSAKQAGEARKLVTDMANIYRDKCSIHPPRDNACSWEANDWYPCGGLSMGMSIFPSGDVSICDKLENVEDFCIGNVFQQGLMEIWQSREMEHLDCRTMDAMQIDQDCAKCSKVNLCKTGCFVDSYNVYGDYFRKHPNCRGYFNNDGELVVTQ